VPVDPRVSGCGGSACGSEPEQQPGAGVPDQTMQDYFHAMILGGVVKGNKINGIGATLGGCWSKPEILEEPHGLVVAYDVGAIGGAAVSLSIVTNKGEHEIFLADGGRLGVVETLLGEGHLITGSPRFSLFNGDAQLVFFDGTITSIREVVHPSGLPASSQTAIKLSQPVTTAWLYAMRRAQHWLWPTLDPVASNCSGEIEFAPQYGPPFASVCPTSNISNVGLTLYQSPSGVPTQIPIAASTSPVTPAEIEAYASR